MKYTAGGASCIFLMGKISVCLSALFNWVGIIIVQVFIPDCFCNRNTVCSVFTLAGLCWEH